ncbi:hypothetical protein LEGA110927_08980 [Leuconostoc gasicomitatum]|uniref:hypothetical protein n=1 Tax=Leuconostoc gasicomitatum TaxID=115778 RepID=UPI000BC9369B|nr:hypothetical protein [Leuconostoc gasicomitatum]SOC16985.1 hypothetical protein LGAA44_230004 [Leuconostoc gasicomitatum]
MPSEHFSRYGKPKTTHTWTFMSFKQSYHEINILYWSYYPMLGSVTHNSRQDISTGKKSTYNFFHIPTDHVEARMVLPDLEEWQKSQINFSNWVRANIVLALVSAFDMYIGRIVSTAIESQPMNFFGIDDDVDGVYNKIHGKYDTKNYRGTQKEIIKAVTKGNWQQRIDSFYNYFPEIRKNQIFEKLDSSGKARKDVLENLRIFRNNYAHALGNDIQETLNDRRAVRIEKRKNISHEMLKKYFYLIFKIARELDDALIKKIGCYEEIIFLTKNLKN